MDIDIKLRSDQDKPYIKITAVVGNAEEAAHLINSIQTYERRSRLQNRPLR